MIGVLLLLAAAAAPPVDAIDPPVTRKCLQNSQILTQRMSAEKGYFAQTRQGWWRNTGPACALFAPTRSLVSMRVSNSQCSGDNVNIIDQISRIDYGACKLGGWERVSESVVPPPYQPARR
jgi:hypothetical protein